MPVTMFSHMDLSGMDLSGVDLTDDSAAHAVITNTIFGKCTRANFACTRGANANFRGVDITDSKFEKAEYTVLQSLVGALWRGIEITKVSDWIIQDKQEDGYWCFVTNAFVQCGCMQKTLQEWQEICQNMETIKALRLDEPRLNLEIAFDWWQKNSTTIAEWCEALA